VVVAIVAVGIALIVLAVVVIMEQQMLELLVEQGQPVKDLVAALA
jgi:hypothetical protein